MSTKPDLEAIRKEFEIRAVRSGGPGGQNVNKVSSKVMLRWNIKESSALTDEQRMRLLQKLHSKLTDEGILVLNAQNKRSQLENKNEVLEKLNQLLTEAFTQRKKRKPTKPTISAKAKRAKEKRSVSEKKIWRRKPDY